ncbi:MAG: OsmC family peroxiredoxin [Thermomicrobiales bacterium]|nr:OsmC family peroxiredoxin [Thermomicrobiales bacterium]
MARHAQSVHEASAHWEGTLTEGSGSVVGSTSGAIKNLPVSWRSRTGGDNSETTPEELLAAAHAACFAMALSYGLQGKQTPAESLDVTAAVGFDPKVGGGFEVSFSELSVKGKVPGVSAEEFAAAVEAASQGCPLSQALKGNVEIVATGELV